jgi:hypothetical protein
MGFDNRKNVSRTADAPSFSAVINEGYNTCTASLTWKKGYKVGAPGVTTRDMDTLMRELTRLDSAVKFYARGADTGTLSAKDAAILEGLRVDVTNTSDGHYRSACQSFGQKPQSRPTKAATPTAQTIVPFHVQGEAYGNFMQAHGELFTGVFAEQNAAVIASWMRDNSRQCDAASLDQCFSECSRLGYFRDARVLTRGMGNDFRVVRPYNHAEVVASRRQQVTDAANQPPAGLSDVDRECWAAVHRAYPNLSVNSPAFKQCMRDTLQKWSRDYALEQNPALATTDARGRLIHAGEWQAAADKVLAMWVRQGNPKLKIGGVGSRVHLD